jgi:hypothetical protein
MPMQNRISDTTKERDGEGNAPQPIGKILEELLAQYERQFPGVRINILDTTATAV